MARIRVSGAKRANTLVDCPECGKFVVAYGCAERLRALPEDKRLRILSTAKVLSASEEPVITQESFLDDQ